MNGTPRTLNRILIGVLGFKLLAIGVLLILLATVPAVAAWWQGWAAGVWSLWRDLFERTRFPGRTNVQLVRVTGPHELEIGIWERGVGPTESSGVATRWYWKLRLN